MGNWRFYFTNPGIVKKEEIPNGWGLYEVHGKRIIHVGGNKFNNTSTIFESCKKSEVALLLASHRGLQNNWENSKKIILNFTEED